MDHANKSRCEDIALKQSLVCATFGLLAALALIAWMFGSADVGAALALPPRMLDSILIAVIALYAAGAYLGRVAGDLIYRDGLQGPRIWVIGIGLAWSCLLISVLAGSSIHFSRKWVVRRVSHQRLQTMLSNLCFG